MTGLGLRAMGRVGVLQEIPAVPVAVMMLIMKIHLANIFRQKISRLDPFSETIKKSKWFDVRPETNSQ